MFGAILRLLSSSTFWSAVVSIVGGAIANAHGADVPAEAMAAVPLAVAWKEGKRHEAAAAAKPADISRVASAVEAAAARLGREPSELTDTGVWPRGRFERTPDGP